jgi:hypothetical protein
MVVEHEGPPLDPPLPGRIPGTLILGDVGQGCAGPSDADPVARDPAPFDVGHASRLIEMAFGVALARRVSGWLAESCRAADCASREPSAVGVGSGATEDRWHPLRRVQLLSSRAMQRADRWR